MINLHHCNILFGKTVKKASEWIDMYTQFILTLNLFHLECNHCHCRGECIRHGYYTRGYILEPDDLVKGARIRILRVKCKHCGKTHAVLPEEIVPYSSYTSTFIGAALDRHYTDGQTVEAVCDAMEIEPVLLYQWKKHFQEQKDRYLGRLESEKLCAREALDKLFKLKDYVLDFAGTFLRGTEKMPMQKHRNPPNTTLPVFS